MKRLFFTIAAFLTVAGLAQAEPRTSVTQTSPNHKELTKSSWLAFEPGSRTAVRSFAPGRFPAPTCPPSRSDANPRLKQTSRLIS